MVMLTTVLHTSLPALRAWLSLSVPSRNAALSLPSRTRWPLLAGWGWKILSSERVSGDGGSANGTMAKGVAGSIACCGHPRLWFRKARRLMEAGRTDDMRRFFFTRLFFSLYGAGGVVVNCSSRAFCSGVKGLVGRGGGEVGGVRVGGQGGVAGK